MSKNHCFILPCLPIYLQLISWSCCEMWLPFHRNKSNLEIKVFDYFFSYWALRGLLRGTTSRVGPSMPYRRIIYWTYLTPLPKKGLVPHLSLTSPSYTKPETKPRESDFQKSVQPSEEIVGTIRLYLMTYNWRYTRRGSEEFDRQSSAAHLNTWKLVFKLHFRHFVAFKSPQNFRKSSM